MPTEQRTSNPQAEAYPVFMRAYAYYLRQPVKERGLRQSYLDSLADELDTAANEIEHLRAAVEPKDDHWWCDTCKREVQPDHVTNDETHDIRAGGCGQHVMEERPSTGSPPSAAINELLSYGGHRYVCDYVERGAKCSCGWQELSARVRAGLTKSAEGSHG